MNQRIPLVMTTLRNGKGWTKAELARRASLSASTVGLIESGRLAPYPVQLEKLAGALEWDGEPSALIEQKGTGKDE